MRCSCAWSPVPLSRCSCAWSLVPPSLAPLYLCLRSTRQVKQGVKHQVKQQAKAVHARRQRHPASALRQQGTVIRHAPPAAMPLASSAMRLPLPLCLPHPLFLTDTLFFGGGGGGTVSLGSKGKGEEVRHERASSATFDNDAFVRFDLSPQP
jgi:hypothetical protein